MLSDLIESCGGSIELITIFNRFSTDVSVKAPKHTIHSVSQDRIRAGIKSILVDKGFTVASADSVDFLQSNAAVDPGDQHRSWHASCIQFVQSMPQTAVESEESVTRRRLFSTEDKVISSAGTECSLPRHMSLPHLESKVKGSDKNAIVPSLHHHSPPGLPILRAQKHKSRGVSDCFVRRPLASVSSESQVPKVQCSNCL